MKKALLALTAVTALSGADCSGGDTDQDAGTEALSVTFRQSSDAMCGAPELRDGRQHVPVGPTRVFEVVVSIPAVQVRGTPRAQVEILDAPPSGTEAVSRIVNLVPNARDGTLLSASVSLTWRGPTAQLRVRAADEEEEIPLALDEIEWAMNLEARTHHDGGELLHERDGGVSEGSVVAIAASVTCGTMAVPGVEVAFSAIPDSRILPSTALTGPDGHARAWVARPSTTNGWIVIARAGRREATYLVEAAR